MHTVTASRFLFPLQGGRNVSCRLGGRNASERRAWDNTGRRKHEVRTLNTGHTVIFASPSGRQRVEMERHRLPPHSYGRELKFLENARKVGTVGSQAPSLFQDNQCLPSRKMSPGEGELIQRNHWTVERWHPWPQVWKTSSGGSSCIKICL